MCMGSGCLMLSNSELEAAFAEIDANGDGLISQEELSPWLTRAAAMMSEDTDGAEALSEAEAGKIFALVDRNRDGTIDFQEFVQAMTAERS